MNRFLPLITPLLVISIVFIGCGRKSVLFHQEDTIPNNIILIIGDGMGLSQISALHYQKKLTSSFTRFQSIGLIEVSSANNKITDSAAGATAFACGQKTYNGAIGVNQDTIPLKSIFQIATDSGYRTGLSVTSSVTHATPASFYAHQKNRSMEEEIAMDLVHSDIDFFSGGGKKFFSERKDGKNLIDSLMFKGFVIDTTGLVNNLKGSKIGYLLAENGLGKRRKRHNAFWSNNNEERGDVFSESVDKAMNHLKSNNFFLLIEGSQIDWAGHQRDSTYLMDEMSEFDQILNQVLDFAQHDGNTLVVHRTGRNWSKQYRLKIYSA